MSYSEERLFAFHRSMLQDGGRVDAFVRAIEALVRPGQVVVDIGTGTGILAMLAARAGARRVYAVEAGDVLPVARELAKDNGLADRIVFLHGRSTDLAVPERADLVVSETLGNDGLNEELVPTMLDARARWLAPGGTLVPADVEVWAAPLSAAGWFEETLGIWSEPLRGLRYDGVRKWVALQPHHRTVGPPELAAPGARVLHVDLATATSSVVSGAATVTPAEDREVHGVALWFRSRLAPGIVIDTAPPNRFPNWGHVILPFERAVAISAGRPYRLALATIAGTTWRWTFGPDGGVPLVDASSFANMPGDAPPPRGAARLNARGEAARAALEALARGEETAAISAAMAASFPLLFPSALAASKFVRELAGQFTEPRS